MIALIEALPKCSISYTHPPFITKNCECRGIEIPYNKLVYLLGRGVILGANIKKCLGICNTDNCKCFIAYSWEGKEKTEIKCEKLTQEFISTVVKKYFSSEINLLQLVKIEDVEDNEVWIRNIGKYSINTSDVKVYVNESEVQCSWKAKFILPYEKVSCVLPFSCRSMKLKVVAPGNSDEVKCE